MSESGQTVRKWAAHWLVDIDDLRRYRRQGAPITSEAGMVAWFDGKSDQAKQNFNAQFKERIEQVRQTLPAAVKASDAQQADDDFAEFERINPAQPAGAGDSAALYQLKRFRDFALFKVALAQKRNDAAGVKDYTKQAMNFSSVIHDEEIRAHRLGRELGEIIQRSEVEGYLSSLTYWQMRCVDDYIGQVVPKLITASAGKSLDRDAITDIIEPPLLDARIVKPIERATATTAGTALPKWFLECIKTAMDRSIEPCPAASQP